MSNQPYPQTEQDIKDGILFLVALADITDDDYLEPWHQALQHSIHSLISVQDHLITYRQSFRADASAPTSLPCISTMGGVN